MRSLLVWAGFIIANLLRLEPVQGGVTVVSPNTLLNGVQVETTRFSDYIGGDGLSCLNVTAQVVLLKDSPCEEIESDRYDHKIVSFEDDLVSSFGTNGRSGCSFEQRYFNLQKAGALGLYTIYKSGRPGKMRRATDSVKYAEEQIIPFLHLGSEGAPIDEALRNGEIVVLNLTNCLDENPWQWYTTTGIGLLGMFLFFQNSAVLFVISRRLWFPLFKLPRAERKEKFNARISIYLIAANITMTILLNVTRMFFGMSRSSSPFVLGWLIFPRFTWDYAKRSSFDLVPLGFDNFSTALIAIYWNELRSAALQFRPVRNIFKWPIVIFIGVICIGQSFVFPVLSLRYHDGPINLNAMRGSVTILLSGVTVYLLVSVRKFEKTFFEFMKSATTDPNEMRQTRAILERYMYWAKVSGLVMLLFVLLTSVYVSVIGLGQPILSLVFIILAEQSVLILAFCKYKTISCAADGNKSAKSKQYSKKSVSNETTSRAVQLATTSISKVQPSSTMMMKQSSNSVSVLNQ